MAFNETMDWNTLLVDFWLLQLLKRKPDVKSPGTQ